MTFYSIFSDWSSPYNVVECPVFSPSGRRRRPFDHDFRPRGGEPMRYRRNRMDPYDRDGKKSLPLREPQPS